ncbi:hypothetical protein [Synechococcus sp. CBW1004]|uniref:hypothetical protein n=1 Tax=Synechococcus sp. CBW1004 TaxID=1353136 RepID=UPI0018CEEF47|nr:hypothetical protein [Synechococcus sp. CBW1004]QPN63162.1 hypothetical protein H8F25_16415 [Synechococcus sp. CBW1004]
MASPKLKNHLLIAAGTLASCIAMSALGQPAKAVPSVSGTFYAIEAQGTSQPFKLTTYTVASNTATFSSSSNSNNGLVCSAAACTQASVNGFSYDAANKTIFFFDNNFSGTNGTPVNNGAIKVNYVSLASGTPQWGTIGTLSNTVNTATSTNNGLAGAAFFNGSIYAIKNTTNTIYKIPILYNGALPTAGQFNNFLPDSMTLGGAPSIATSAYGDIAIDSAGGLYGVTANDRLFYKYNIQNFTNGGTLSPIINPVSTGLSENVQIAFSGGPTLFATNAAGNWYSINTATGAASALPFTSPGGPLVADLAGATPVPGPLPILGAGVAFSASRKMRKRIQVSRTNPVSA